MFSGQLGTAALGTWQLGQTQVSAVNLNPTVIDTLVFTDKASSFDVTVIDTLALSDNAQRTKSRIGAVNDGLIFTDTLRNSNIVAIAGDSLVFTDYVNNNVTHTASVIDTLDLRDSISFPIRDSFAYTDSLIAVKSRRGLAADTLAYTELTRGVVTTIRDIYTITDTVLATKTVNLAVFDSYVLDDTGTAVKRAKIANLQDTLTFTDKLIRDAIRVTANDSLITNDAASALVIYRRRAADVLIIADGLRVNKTLNLVAGDSISYLEDLYVFKVDTFMFFQGTRTSMYINNPLFNDYSSNQGKLMVTRAMTGKVRTYVKTTKRRKLNYRFAIAIPKSTELRQFIINNHGDFVIVHDFEGKRWKTKLITDSIDFEETARWSPCGNRVEVTIEFEGVQL